jgi:hypothetical protein
MAVAKLPGEPAELGAGAGIRLDGEKHRIALVSSGAGCGLGPEIALARTHFVSGDQHRGTS